MPEIKVSVTITVDGRPLPGFDPYIRRVVVDEVAVETYELADGSGHVSIPSAQVAEHTVQAFTTTKQVTARIDGQSDAGLVVNAGGLYLAVDIDADAGAATNLTIANASGATATVKGIAAGT